MSAPFAPIVIRVSALSNYADCPRRGAARLFWKQIRDYGYRLRPTRRGIGAIVGIAEHKAVATCFGHKARTGTLPTGVTAVEVAVTELQAGIAGARGDIEFDGPNGATANQNEAEQQIIRMTTSYWLDVAPSVDAILVEERLEAEVSPGLILSGQPDIVAREPGAVRDLKTGVRMGNHSPQLGGYSLLARSHNLEITQAVIDWVPRVRLSKGQPLPVSASVPVAAAETAASNIVRHIEGDLRTFEEGDEERRIKPGDPWAFLANPSSSLCSPKYCPAFGTDFCHEGDPQRAKGL